jgi:putative ABC transport system substrate-binding protein
MASCPVVLFCRAYCADLDTTTYGGDHVKRRKFIALLGGAAVVWPFGARAQQPAMPVIGYLSARSPEDTRHLLEAVLRGLGEQGFVEGQNVLIEHRYALGQYDRLPAMAAELIGRQVTVLTATGGENAAYAARGATSIIPIVFVIGGDPVREGFAASFNRPGGNATGITLLTNQLEPKRLGLLHQLLPSASNIGFLLNSTFAESERQLADAQEAARANKLQLHVLKADFDRDIDAAFETVAQQRLNALAVGAGPFFDTRREKIVGLAARYAVPTMYHFREFVAAGGLISYGVDPIDVYRQAGAYTGRVLKGAKAADLPIMQATKFEFVINLKTAKTLGLTVPEGLIAAADEVIE